MSTLSKTKIEWAANGTNSGYVWNIVTGCHKKSKGCQNCYAEALAKRFWGERKFSDVELHEERLTLPLRIKKPSTIFVNSMSDLFNMAVPYEFVQKALHIMAVTPNLHYIILTKSPEQMREFFSTATLPDFTFFADNPLPNVTLGVSVESNQHLDRIAYLLATPASKRIISFEPLLEEVNAGSAMAGKFNYEPYNAVANPIEGAQIDHAIIGGESGGGARVCQIEWIRSLVNQCLMLGTKVFIKQLGAKSFYYAPNLDELRRWRTNSRKGSDWKEFPADLQFRAIIHPSNY